jgi:NAD(P)-dependent dehydrogenase (short-subunit alcohol dehydrogenase family)
MGQAIADRLAVNGSRVVYTDLDLTATETAAARSAGAKGLRMDVTCAQEIEAVIAQVVAEFCRLGVLVNNAGVNTLAHRVPIDQFPREEWDRLLNVDLTGVYEVSRVAARVMRSQGSGRIINIAPGSTLTEGTKQLFYGEGGKFRDHVQRMLDHVPLGRPATTDEIAVAVLFLADPENSYMNGHILTIDGGWAAGYNRDF